MEKELNNILQKYNWSYYKKSESEYDIYNKKNLKVAIIKFSANKYIIYDSDGKNKLMSGKGQVADSVEKLLTKYFYATPITLQQYFTVTEKEFTDAKQKNKKLIEEYAKLNIPEKNDSEIKKIILQDKLVKATKLFAEVGDVVYSLKKDIIYGIESDFKEYKIRTLNKNENTLMGGSDVIIETGYIAGGYDGRAILKKAYDVYLNEAEKLYETKVQDESDDKPETMKKTTKYYKLRVFSIQDFAEFLKELKGYADDIKVFSAGIGEEYLIVTGDYDEQAAMHPMTSVTDFDDIISRSKKIQTYKRLDSKPTPEQRWQGKWVSADERIKHIEQVLKDDNDEEQQQVIEKTDKTEFLKKKISAYKKLLPIVSTEKKAFLQKKIKAFELLVSLNEKKIAEDDIESQILHYKNILRNIDKYPNYNKKNVEIIISELENKKKASSEPVFNRLPEDKQKELKGEWDKMKDFIETTGHQIAIGQLRDLTPEQQSGLVLDTLMKGETINADNTDYLITQKNDKKIVIKNLKTQKTGTIYVMGNEYVSWMKTRKDGTATGFSRAIETDITRSLLDENNPMGALQTDSYLRAKTRLEEIRAEQYNKNNFAAGGTIIEAQKPERYIYRQDGYEIMAQVETDDAGDDYWVSVIKAKITNRPASKAIVMFDDSIENFINEYKGHEGFGQCSVKTAFKNFLKKHLGVSFADGGSVGKITIMDIVEGNKFQIKGGTIFIIDKVYPDIKFGAAVETSIEGGKKGNYRDTAQEVIDFLNENNAVRLYADGGTIYDVDNKMKKLLIEFYSHKFNYDETYEQYLSELLNKHNIKKDIFNRLSSEIKLLYIQKYSPYHIKDTFYRDNNWYKNVFVKDWSEEDFEDSDYESRKRYFADGGNILSNKEKIINIDFEDNTDLEHGRYDFTFETIDTKGSPILEYDGYIIESPSSSRKNDEFEWGQNVPEDWETAEDIILNAFYEWKEKRNNFSEGGGIDNDNYLEYRTNLENKIEGLKLRLSKAKRKRDSYNGKDLHSRISYHKIDKNEVEPLLNELKTLSDKYNYGDDNSSRYDLGGGVSPYTLTKSQHTKTGKDIWIIKLSDRVDRNTYNAIASKIKQNGGYWSSFVKGFVFSVEPNPDILDHIFGVAAEIAQKNESVPYNQRGLIAFNEANPHETVNRATLRQEWEAGKMLAGKYRGFDGMTDSSYYIADDKIVWYEKGQDKYMDDSIASDWKSSYDKAHIDYVTKTIEMGWNKLKYKPEIQITDIKKKTGLFSYNYYVNIDKKPPKSDDDSKINATNHDKDFDLPNGTRVRASFYGKNYCGTIVGNRIHQYSTTSYMLFSGNEKKVEHHKYIYYDILFDNGIKEEMQVFEVITDCNEIEQPLLMVNNKLEYADSVWNDIKSKIGTIARLKSQLAGRKLEKYRIEDRKDIANDEKELFEKMGIFLAYEMVAAPFIEGITGENESEQQERRNLWKEKLNIVPAGSVEYSAKEIVETETQNAEATNKYLVEIKPLIEKYNLEKGSYANNTYYFYADPEKRFALKIEIKSFDIKTTLMVKMAAIVEEKTFNNIADIEKYILSLKETYKDFWDNEPKDYKNIVNLPFAITRGSKLIGIYELKQNNMLAIDKIMQEADRKTTIVLLTDNSKSQKDIAYIEIYKSESSYNSWQGNDFVRTVKFFNTEGDLLSKTTFSTYEGTFGSGLQNFYWARAWKYWAKDKLPSMGLKMAKNDNAEKQPEEIQEFKGYIVGETVNTALNDNVYVIKGFKDTNKPLQEKALLHPIKLVIGGKDTFIDENDTTFDSEYNYADLEKISEPDIKDESEVKVVSEEIIYPNQTEQDVIELAEEMGETAFKNDVKRIPLQDKQFRDFFIENEATQNNMKAYYDAWYRGWDNENLKSGKIIDTDAVLPDAETLQKAWKENVPINVAKSKEYGEIYKSYANREIDNAEFDEKVAKLTYQYEQMDKIHPLDLWTDEYTMENGDSGVRRKFQFKNEEDAKRFHKAVLDKIGGANFSIYKLTDTVVVYSASLGNALEISDVFMREFPMEGQVIQPEKENIQPTQYSSGYKELLKDSNDDYNYFVSYDDNTISINSFSKHTGMASLVQTFYIDKINDADIQEPLKSKIISELKKKGKLSLILGKPNKQKSNIDLIDHPAKDIDEGSTFDLFLKSVAKNPNHGRYEELKKHYPSYFTEPEKPKGKLVIEPDVMKLIEYLKKEPDSELRAEMWNDGEFDDNDKIITARRDRIIKGTGRTLWQIASWNGILTPVVVSGIESKLAFDGNDLLRALKNYARNNNMDIEIEKPSDVIQEKPEQQPEKAALTKESIEKLIRALEIQNKYKPSEAVTKRINALKIVLKYKK